jgi:hypothetical protein
LLTEAGVEAESEAEAGTETEAEAGDVLPSEERGTGPQGDEVELELEDGLTDTALLFDSVLGVLIVANWYTESPVSVDEG